MLTGGYPLLTLAVEPEAFFAVANLVHTRSR